MTNKPLRFRDASIADVPQITAIHNAAAGALTARYGDGPWSSCTTERSTELSMKHANLRVGRIGTRIVTVLRLATKKPWAIDVDSFTPVKRALYLTGMSVSVAMQQQGYGRLALKDAIATARSWPADSIRLDAYDAPAGAGGFYAASDFTECGRVKYKGAPLLYFEYLL